MHNCRIAQVLSVFDGLDSARGDCQNWSIGGLTCPFGGRTLPGGVACGPGTAGIDDLPPYLYGMRLEGRYAKWARPSADRWLHWGRVIAR